MSEQHGNHIIDFPQLTEGSSLVNPSQVESVFNTPNLPTITAWARRP